MANATALAPQRANETPDVLHADTSLVGTPAWYAFAGAFAVLASGDPELQGAATFLGGIPLLSEFLLTVYPDLAHEGGRSGH